MINNGKIVAIVPVYNEEQNIKNTIINLKQISVIDEIVIVDDGSTDNTVSIVKSLEVKLISLDKNYGKGYAIKKAIDNIKYDYLLLVDGDLGESSKEVKKLIDPVISNIADVSIAKFPSPSKKSGFGLVKKFSKYGIYLLTGVRINSSLSGQRVYKKSVIDSMKYIPNNFGIEVAMTVGAIKNGFKIKEIPVSMTHRVTGRNVKGFLHRGKQFFHISFTFFNLVYRR